MTPPLALVADIGGTNVRFALVKPGGQPTCVVNMKCKEYPRFTNAVDAYLDRLGRRRRPTTAAFAVAGPVLDDPIRLTNSPWVISAREVARRYDFTDVHIINDFSAIALAIPRLRSSDRQKVGRGRPVRHAAIGVIGPGTGLGVSGLVWTGSRYVPLASEGGNVTLPVFDDFEMELVRIVRREHTHVSAERLLSGAGLAHLYRAIAEMDGVTVTPLLPETVTRRARSGQCTICRRAVDTFCAMLGTVAGDLALTLGALGGVFVAGGIIRKLGPAFQPTLFRRRFESKGRFKAYLAAVPTWLITHTNPGLAGLAYSIETKGLD